jgi:hypothetical protein
VVGLVLGVSLTGLGGCGVVHRVMSTPTITEVPSQPDEITPTVPVPGVSGAPAADASSTGGASTDPTPHATPARPKLPAPGALQPTERLVVVDSLGIGFAASTLSTEIDPEKYVEGSAALEELSRVMGLSPTQVRNGLLDRIERMVTAVGDDGRITSIVVTRIPSTELPTEALIRRGIGATMNARVTRVDRPITAAGRSIHAVYRLGTAGDYHYGEALYLDTAEGAVSVAVTARSAAEAKRLGGRVLKTLRTVE